MLLSLHHAAPTHTQAVRSAFCILRWTISPKLYPCSVLHGLQQYLWPELCSGYFAVSCHQLLLNVIWNSTLLLPTSACSNDHDLACYLWTSVSSYWWPLMNPLLTALHFFLYFAVGLLIIYTGSCDTACHLCICIFLSWLALPTTYLPAVPMLTPAWWPDLVCLSMPPSNCRQVQSASSTVGGAWPERH